MLRLAGFSPRQSLAGGQERVTGDPDLADVLQAVLLDLTDTSPANAPSGRNTRSGPGHCSGAASPLGATQLPRSGAPENRKL
jgi:hypothetical protein